MPINVGVEIKYYFPAGYLTVLYYTVCRYNSNNLFHIFKYKSFNCLLFYVYKILLEFLLSYRTFKLFNIIHIMYIFLISPENKLVQNLFPLLESVGHMFY